jgi:hypothetical protein
LEAADDKNAPTPHFWVTAAGTKPDWNDAGAHAQIPCWQELRLAKAL